MNQQRMLCATATLLFASSSLAASPEAVPGEYVVKARRLGEAAVNSFALTLRSRGAEITEVINRDENIYLVRSSAKAQALKALADVEVVEPNYIYRAFRGAPPPTQPPAQPPVTPPAQPPRGPQTVIPDDPSFASLWGIRNTGQADSSGRKGSVGADTKAPEAWTLTTGERRVLVAVIDTGVDYNHPDLKDNIWTKPGTTDVHGFNAITGVENPMDDHYHGTHCAGTIGAVGDNGIGVTGVAWKVSIMGVKFLDKNGSGTLANAIKAIDYAVDNGAQILSNSWGGGAFSENLRDAITRAHARGAVFVAAAGNSSNDNDKAASYPASYPVDNVVSVAASNNIERLASFSNYGKASVDIAAPGENILSTATGNTYRTLSGTSMATPHVSGALALLLAREPALTPGQMRARLIATADQSSAYSTKTVSGGRLNVVRLLTGK